MKFYSKKLKKFFAMICAFCLIVEFSLSGIQVKAAEAIPRITYTVTGEATIGKQITISLNVSNISGLYGGSWDFAYDPNIIKIDEITAGDLISSIPQTTTSNKSGHAYFWFTKTGDTTGVSTTEAKSIAKIKATVLKEGTININTTNSDNSFGVNNKNSLVKLSDMNGDKISYSSEDKSISCIKPVIVLQPGIYQENNSAFKYHGTWDTFAKSEHSDGSIKLSTAKGNFLE
ncbi:MAG: cohesin domain-containing protein, partial [Clostridium sp.]